LSHTFQKVEITISWNVAAKRGNVTSNMLTDYIEHAMRKAHYEMMGNGNFFGTIPKCKGLWAEGKTLEKCREELRSTLEDWLLLGLQLGHTLPVIDGINLNRSNRLSVHAQAH
jgi:predicted RNase H-like HicB family nuclease